MRKILTVVIWITLWLMSSSCSQDTAPLTIGFWNVENLFDLADDPEKNDEEFSTGGRKNVTQEIYDLKIKNTAEMLADLNADVVGLCEVENRFVLEEVNQAYTGRDYKIIHYESPDSRGIDNALLYDPSVFKVVDSRAIDNPLPNNVKTRDILYVKGEYGGEIIHLFVNHWPSNYGGRKKAISKTCLQLHIFLQRIFIVFHQRCEKK